MMDHANFTYSSLVKALEKQTRTIEDQGREQFESLKVSKPDFEPQLTVTVAIPEGYLNEESKNWNWENHLNRNNRKQGRF